MGERAEQRSTVNDGDRFRHLNTGEVWRVAVVGGDLRVHLECESRASNVWAWPAYLLNPHNFEALPREQRRGS
jgi:hypothetical protein